MSAARNRSFVLLFAAALSVPLISSGADSASFNINSSTPFLNASTQNQQFTIDIGSNGTNPGFNIDWINLTIYPSSGLAYVPNSNSTSASNSTFVYDTSPNILGPGVVVLTWKNTTSAPIIPLNTVRQFRANFSTPLSSAPIYIEVYALYENGIGQKGLPGAFVGLTTPPINAVVGITGPPNGSTYPYNDVNISFMVNGTSSYYACIPFTNKTTPYGTFFEPAFAPPNFNVSNATNTNISLFLPFGFWQWNVKCTPKDSYVATRTSNGYNVTKGSLPTTLNSFKVGDIITFVNGMPNSITITFQPPMMPPYTINLTAGANATIDTSPDFSNPAFPKPPLMGPFFDNVTDQYNFSVLGGFGQSGDPKFSPGVFSFFNSTLNVTGPAKPNFDPGQFFMPGQGFQFQDGPCAPSAPSPKPPFCFPSASGGASFDPNNVRFFDEHPDFVMSGFTDCTNPANAAKPDCKLILDPFAEIVGDSTSPNLLFTKVSGFSDNVFVDFGTDEMTNMTITYYGADQYCGNGVTTITDDGARFPNGTLMPNSRFKPFHHFELNSRINANINIASNTTYYYKTNICDKAGNCVASSSCKSLNSSTTAFASTPIGLNFTIPPGFDFKMRFPNGSEVSMGSAQSFANMTNVTMRFQPSGASWGIDLPASSIATASSFDFSSGFKSVTTGGKTLVGMNKTMWDALSQRLGITSINITIVGTGDALVKCDDDGGNCNDVTVLAAKMATNSTSGTSTWNIPTTLGFSTYSDAAPAAAAASTSTSSDGGGGGGTASSSGSKKLVRIFALLDQDSPVSLSSSDFTSLHSPLNGLAISVSEPSSGVKVTFEKLDARPAAVGSDPSGELYSYVGISVENLDESSISSASVTFDVNRSWIDGNGIDESTVVLNRFSGGAWQSLETAKLSEGAESVTFQAETPGFSTFAITAQKSVPQTVEEGAEAAPERASEAEAAAPEGAATGGQPAQDSVLLIIVAGAVLVAVAYLVVRKLK